MNDEKAQATETPDSAASALSAGFGGVATPAPMDPGVLVVRTTSGAEFIFDAGTHSYEVWVNDKKRWRKVEITLHTDKGSWIVKTIDFPASIERQFSTPNDRVEGRDAASSRRVRWNAGLCITGENRRKRMNLHGQVMNLQAKPYDGTDAYTHYCRGHKDARHAAAELAVKADAVVDAARAVLAWRVDTPLRGDLRDNDSSRKALRALAEAVAAFGDA